MLSHSGACVSVDLSNFGASYPLHCNAPLCIWKYWFVQFNFYCPVVSLTLMQCSSPLCVCKSSVVLLLLFFHFNALPTSTTGVIISHWNCVYVRCFSVLSLSVIAFLVSYFICFLLLFHSFQCINHVNHCCYISLTLCVRAVHCNSTVFCILLFGRFRFSIIKAAS